MDIVKGIQEMAIKGHPLLKPPENFTRRDKGCGTLFLVEIQPGRKAYRYDVDVTMVHPNWERSLAKGSDDYNFLNPDDKNVHTQHVERMWSMAKWRNKRQRGTKRDLLETYLAEFMTRQEMKAADKDPFDSMLDKIAKCWPPAL